MILDIPKTTKNFDQIKEYILTETNENDLIYFKAKNENATDAVAYYIFENDILTCNGDKEIFIRHNSDYYKNLVQEIFFLPKNISFSVEHFLNSYDIFIIYNYKTTPCFGNIFLRSNNLNNATISKAHKWFEKLKRLQNKNFEEESDNTMNTQITKQETQISKQQVIDTGKEILTESANLAAVVAATSIVEKHLLTAVQGQFGKLSEPVLTIFKTLCFFIVIAFMHYAMNKNVGKYVKGYFVNMLGNSAGGMIATGYEELVGTLSNLKD